MIKVQVEIDKSGFVALVINIIVLVLSIGILGYCLYRLGFVKGMLYAL